MTIEPTLGTGLFIGSGQALAAGGPASLLGSYIFISVLVYCLTTAMAEVATHVPMQDGAMVTHAYQYTSSHLGFSLGYLRWYSTAMLVPFEITNAMVNVGLWDPGPKVAIRVTLVACVIIGFNMLPERVFKRSEAVFTGVKFLTTIGLGILSIYLAIRGVPGSNAGGFHYWNDPGAMNDTISFIFSPELIVQRGEQLNAGSTRSIMHMAQIDNAQLLVLYILSALAITLVAPSDDPSLTNNGTGAGKSPYVVGAKRAMIPILPSVVAILIFCSSVASGRSFLYTSSRTLCSLAETGHAPSWFKVRNKHGVPYVAVGVTALFSGLAYLSLAISSSAVFNLLMYFITTSGYISWLCACVVYLHFRRAVQAQGITSVHQARIQPYGAYFGLFSSALLPLANAVIIAAPSRGISRNAVPVYIGILLFLTLYAGHQVRAAIAHRFRRPAAIMTDTSPVAITHPTTDPYPVAALLNSPAVNGAVSDSAAPEEEEPYTIKCICSFEDDDGNTHIECYYHGREVPEVHNCVDCEPRPLDGRRATERQRRLREQGDGGDRKKRSGAKSQKKKTKDHADQANGFHHRSESSSRDQPPAKKSKTGHRTSGSVGSLSSLPPLQPDARKRTSTSMSPTKPSGPSIPLYSNEFLHLYDRDQDYASMDSNLFNTLNLAGDLASWVTDPTALARVTNGRSAQDVFTWSGAILDRSRWPSLTTESITDRSIDVDGTHPTWKVLKTQDRIGKDEIVGEITGKIGLLRDYCLDPNNRWQELRHPEPFVFFHPQLPIYIDSRHEGSLLRYVRRSCRPNVTMKTYITNEVEYHFCFVAKEDIAPDSEITAMWYLDPQLFESTNGLVKQESSDTAQDLAAICISNVLAHFGGCACVPPPNCLLSSVDRRRHPRALDAKQASAKRKKTKSKSNLSPPATNSRAGSEAVKNQDEDDQADSRSASGSTRGPRSRDLTPTFPNSADGHLFGDTELSAREKRKIAAAEKKFQQLEQDQQASQKKKKRPSGHSTQATPTIGSSQSGYFPQQSGRDRRSYSPPAKSPNQSTRGRHGSPRRMASPSNGLQKYVDSAIQADLDGSSDGSSPVSPPSPRRPSFIPLAQRLLKRCYADRVRLEQINRAPVSPSHSNTITQLTSPSPSTHAAAPLTATTPSVSGEKEDVEMKDAESPARPSPGRPHSSEMDSSPLSGRDMAKPPVPPPWPSTAAHNARIPGSKVAPQRADLQIPIPPMIIPPQPSASTPGSATTPSLSSPSTFETPQHPPIIPGSSVAAPSPVKKKLSLGDYLIRRGTKATPTTEKTQTQATAMPPPPKSPTNQAPTSTTGDNAHSESKAAGEAETPRGGNPSSPDVAMKDVPGSKPSSQVPSLT
ncbi:amino acid permease-domain-containing protein [Aspergillus ambiguus]|uniref:amino acid permease-domain-containing protein n=1 Tax=Aspergillus ambiguus TaxID=176160 RepID=UPI003CCD1EB5